MDTVNDKDLQRMLGERLKQLPKVVQDAITSADIEKHLRELSDTHKLHLDQWQLLENEVMLTLLGFEEPEDLPANLKKELNVAVDVADALTEDISRIVFAPIRAELERELATNESSPDQHEAGVAAAHQTASPPITPATLSPAAPVERAMRTPISESYNAGEASHARKVVEDDPYREQTE